MLNWIMRYRTVIDMLDELCPASVLDVGSGWFGLSWYWPEHVVQTDLSFADRPASQLDRAGSAEFVLASAEDLPFRDSAFDYAVSLDMIEHLPRHIRASSIAELARVSRRGFIIGYPVGKRARTVDRLLSFIWKISPGQAVPPWLVEHLGQESYPDRTLLEDALPVGWRVTREFKSGNAVLQTLIVWMESLPGGGRVTARLERLIRARSLPAWVDAGATYRSIWLVEPDALPVAPLSPRGS